MKKISIIIPNYNSGRFLKEAVESCINQSYSNIEIIIIDDGSTDQSLLNIENLDKRIKIFTQENKGATAARNKGLDLSEGEYVKFLDADDVIEKKALSEQIKLLEEQPENSLVYGNYYIGSHDLRNKIIKKNPVINNKEISSIILSDILISTPLHRKSNLINIGGFDESLKEGQEWDLHVRLLYSGINYIYMDTPIFTYRSHNSEHRISKTKSSNSYRILNSINKFIALSNTLKVDNNARAALSLKIWEAGRLALRKKNVLTARTIFKESIKVSPNEYKKYWEINYRRTYNIFGPLLTEIILYCSSKLK